jgi:hypothetical protein
VFEGNVHKFKGGRWWIDTAEFFGFSMHSMCLKGLEGKRVRVTVEVVEKEPATQERGQ